MNKHRPDIPSDLKRQVLIESGHRCAIPQCSHSANIDIHHIIPWSQCKKHEFDNLIALCPNCHRLVHDRKIDRKSLLEYKKNLPLIDKERSISNSSNNSRLDIAIYKKLIEVIPVNLYQRFKSGSFGDHETMKILKPIHEFINLCDDPTFVFKNSMFESEKILLLDSANNAVNYIRPHLQEGNRGTRIGPTEGSLGNDLKAMHRLSSILEESTGRMFDFFKIYNNLIKKLTMELQ